MTPKENSKEVWNKMIRSQLISPCLTVRQASEQLGVSPGTLRRYIAAGVINAVRLPAIGGGKPGDFRIRKADFDEFMETLCQPSNWSDNQIAQIGSSHSRTTGKLNAHQRGQKTKRKLK